MNDTPQPERHTPHTPNPLWTLLLPLALLGGALWQNTRAPENPLSSEPVPIGNSVTQPPGNKPPEKYVRYVLYAPDDNAQLTREIITDKNFPVNPGDVAERATEIKIRAMNKAVELLLQKHPDDFPRGTTLSRPITLGGGIPTVSFNQRFADPQFWQGSARTLATVYSLVNTMVETKNEIAGGSEKNSVRILIEGKPVSTLGEFDASEPIEPYMSLVRKD